MPSGLLPALALLLLIALAEVSGCAATGRIQLISVIGERHSGTNYMRQLMEHNFGPLGIRVDENFCQFKHKYQSLVPECPPLHTTVVVAMVRNPVDWALAMHTRCWCKNGSKLMAKLSFEEFATSTLIDNGPKPWLGETEFGLCPHLLACRALKYANFINMSTWVPHFMIVRHEDVLKPEQAMLWVQNFSERYGLGLRQPVPITFFKNREDRNFDPEEHLAHSLWMKRHHTELLEQEPALRDTLAMLIAHMNVSVESQLGYEV